MRPLRFPALGRDSGGTTLVELMVAVGLFGGLSLALMNLFGDYSQRMAKAQNEGRLSEEVLEFQDTLEVLMGNATQIISCGCGNTCVLNPAAPAECVAGGGCATTLFRWETEDANDPSARAYPGCVGGDTITAVATDGLLLRGCKKRMRLELRVPPANGLTPGYVRLMSETPVEREIFRLNGVYAVSCGAPSAASKGQFRIDIRLKSRSSNWNAPTLAEWQSWHPLGQNFWRGTHRTMTTNIAFRNLLNPSIHYGKSVTTASCLADNEADPSRARCCSGYVRADTTCLPALQCVGRNGASAAAGLDCCSHQVLPTGACS